MKTKKGKKYRGGQWRKNKIYLLEVSKIILQKMSEQSIGNAEKIKSEFPAPKLVRKVQQNVLSLPLSLAAGKTLQIEVPDYVELYFLYQCLRKKLWIRIRN